MKPQALQDAIKAQAEAKAKRRQQGMWKEPVVKKHQVTADELKQGHVLAPQIPPTVSNAGYSNAPRQPAVSDLDLEGIRVRMAEMNKEIKQQRFGITSLQKENTELRDLIRSLQNATTTASTTSPSSAPPSPASPKKAKTPASLEPHTAKELVEEQRKDKTLRHFMKTKEGLPYEVKNMSIRSESSAGNIVCFKRKIFIPEKLRDKTMEHYKNRFPNDSSAALNAMRKNCCWPDLEKDFFGGGPHQ